MTSAAAVNAAFPQRKTSDLSISASTRALFTSYYGLHNQHITDDEIAAAITRVQQTALVTHPYRCIQDRAFAEPRITHHPQYETLIKPRLSSSRILDVGCCFGTDIRQMILEGAHADSILGVDIQSAFIECGFELFRDRERLSGRFAVADILSADARANPPLKEFADGGIDLIYAGSLYHVLDEAQTEALTAAFAALISPGGLLIGRTVASADPVRAVSAVRRDHLRFLHSVATLKLLFEKNGFVDVSIVTANNDLRSWHTDSGSEEEKAHRAEVVHLAFTATSRPSSS